MGLLEICPVSSLVEEVRAMTADSVAELSRPGYSSQDRMNVSREVQGP